MSKTAVTPTKTKSPLPRARRQSERLTPNKATPMSLSTPPSSTISVDPTLVRLQRILDRMPHPVDKYRLQRSIGQGTFSTVYLAEVKVEVKEEVKEEHAGGRQRMAIKHIIPTSSPERILMEVNCLRLCNGINNVIPLLFCHRILGDIVIAMPYIKTPKFHDVIANITYSKMVFYMKNLLQALEHIHSLGIIHRDVKPANFMFDYALEKFYLIDFGLAQMTGEVKDKGQAITPSCKRKLDSSDLGDSSGSPVKKKSRSPLKQSSQMMKKPAQPRTPDSNYKGVVYDHYDQRGSLKREPLKPLPTIKREGQLAEKQAAIDEARRKEQGPKRPATTPRKKKSLEELQGEISVVRRSPRKHHSLPRKSTPGYSKLTISGSTIVGNGSSHGGSTLSKTPSFTMLDPTSGIPSADYTPRLQASLTSHSFGNSSAKSATLNSSFAHADSSNCHCFGLPQICNRCTMSNGTRRSLKAARAGTPGFRPPEVLLKCEHQTTAVDMWAAGVIMLCLLSRTYPFFRAQDDLINLAEMLNLFGTDAVRQAACQYDRKLLCNEYRPGFDLANLCYQLAHREGVDKKAENLVTDESIDLLTKLLKLLANERITAEEALKHPMFRS